jgi:hypothetical protein
MAIPGIGSLSQMTEGMYQKMMAQAMIDPSMMGRAQVIAEKYAMREAWKVDHPSMFLGMLMARPKVSGVRALELVNEQAIRLIGVAEHGEFHFDMPHYALQQVSQQAVKQGEMELARMWIEAGICFPPDASIKLIGATLYKDIPVTHDDGATWEPQSIVQLDIARTEAGMQQPAIKICTLQKDFPGDLLHVQIRALL